MNKRFLLSVTDFAIACPLEGSIDKYSGINDGNKVGIQLHKEIQQQRGKQFSTYISEKFVTHDFAYKKYVFKLSGRMDGIYQTDVTTIEEIKSGFNLNKLHSFIINQMDSHPFCLQLRTYGYIHWLTTGEEPTLNLHLVSSRNKKFIDLKIELNKSEYEEWLQRRLSQLASQVQDAEKLSRFRKKVAKKLTFPFSNPRPGQLELTRAVTENFKQSNPLLLQAPTGLGKTVGVLFPALHESLSRGQKVIYCTPKNSQHLVAEDATRKLQSTTPIKAMTLTAKSKLCFKSQTLCNSEYCEYAKDYYSKITQNNIITKLQKIENLTAKHVREIGLEYQVCPYQLQLDSTQWRDIIICDYNYVFSPHSSSQNISKMFIGENEQPNLIIDEFHNLPERGMSYYSPQVSAFIIRDWILSIDHIDSKFKDEAQSILSQASVIIQNCGFLKPDISHIISPPVKLFKELELKLREFVSHYLESDIEILTNDIVLSFFNYWTEFTSALEYVENSDKEFFTSYLPRDMSVKITCCDASQLLQPYYHPFKNVVGFSATLKPFYFYSQLSGINSPNLKTVEFDSPFSKLNRKMLIIPQVSSKYSERAKNYPKIAEAITKITRENKGNYFIFFPSFDFLEKVLNIFKMEDDFTILSQTRRMTSEDIAILMTKLADRSQYHLVFAVQGGVLAEGVDYPGEMIVGALIVGVPLPQYDWEREQMKQYYEKAYKAGVDYAYVFPAMAKAIQSAGRVIRSDSDKGLILLMDSRFLLENYIKCMPVDWTSDSFTSLISNSVLNDVRQFWQSTKNLI